MAALFAGVKNSRGNRGVDQPALGAEVKEFGVAGPHPHTKLYQCGQASERSEPIC